MEHAAPRPFCSGGSVSCRTSIPSFHDVSRTDRAVMLPEGKDDLQRLMLTEIRARLDVRCPDCEATRHLTTFIDQHIVDADVVAIPLRLSKRTLEYCLPPLERRVFATLSAPRSAGDLRLMYSLNLAHDRDRSVPYFSGSLAINANNADDCFDFSLAGQYLPTAGMMSDLTLGTRIAKASASALLHTIATYVKVASARNDAARAGKRQHRLPSGPPPTWIEGSEGIPSEPDTRRRTAFSPSSFAWRADSGAGAKAAASPTRSLDSFSEIAVREVFGRTNAERSRRTR